MKICVNSIYLPILNKFYLIKVKNKIHKRNATNLGSS